MSKARTDQMVTPQPIGLSTYLFLLLFLLLCGAFGTWAHFGKLDVVSQTTGAVVPSSQIKSIQHLEGGVIKELLIKEGERVTKGQELIVLEAISSGADVDEIQVRMDALKVEIARLSAEAEVKEKLIFPETLAVDRPELKRQAKSLFKINRRKYLGDLQTQSELIAQRKQDIREISVKLRNSRKNLKLIDEQIKISEDLLKDQLTNRYNHLTLLREAGSLRSDIEEAGAAFGGAKAALKEAENERKRVTQGVQQKAQVRLEKARRELQEHSQRIRKFEDSLRRTVLRSPVDGVVKTLYVYTVGGVVKAGQTVANIVPAGDQLIIESRLPTQDIGFVMVGQTAFIRLASSDALRFGNIEGEVIAISPDTYTDQDDGQVYYKIRIATEADHFSRGAMRYNLFPGMQVSASIRTGERSVLEYLLTPFLASTGDAFRER
ncbi:MAG: HlyD family type I secretion periplasmic adaptor subunit [Candidatus Sedimenticola sp. (ex Thyasira tokunagai)]